LQTHPEVSLETHPGVTIKLTIKTHHTGWVSADEMKLRISLSS
jgi:hypothetical protein